MNPSALTTTETVDAVFLFIFGIAALMLVGITVTIIFCVVKYSRRRNPSPLPSPYYNIPLEAAWTILPTIIVMVMFWYGWSGYTTLRNVPTGALPVKVVGRMWSWSFEYATTCTPKPSTYTRALSRGSTPRPTRTASTSTAPTCGLTPSRTPAPATRTA